MDHNDPLNLAPLRMDPSSYDQSSLFGQNSGQQSFGLPNGLGSFKGFTLGYVPSGGGSGGAGPESSIPEFGFNLPTFNVAGNVLGGIGKLAQGWAAIKGLGMARDSFEQQKEMANKNYDAMATTVNNRINDQNAWKTAQGRTDLAKLVV